MALQTEYDHLFKILVIGDTGCGKTSIMQRFVEGTFDEQFVVTVGTDFKEKIIEVNEKSIKLQIWDTAGQERFRAINSSYYRGAHGIIVVYDVTDTDSFENTQTWLGDISRYACSEVPRILIGNKCDDITKKEVDYIYGKDFSEKEGMPFIETSAKDGTNILEAFELITEEMIKSIASPELPGVVDINSKPPKSEKNCAC